MSGAIGSILSNFGALEALDGLASTQGENNTLETELSTGLSINSPADNPAGFIQAQGFDAQINGITQASANANEGISLLQTAQGAVQQQLNLAQKLNSIAVQAANGTQTPAEAQSLQGVVSQLTGQVTTIADQTQFNDISLLNGTFNGVQFQVGADEGQTIDLSISNTEAGAIGLNTLNSSASAAAPLFKASPSAAVTATGSAFTAGSLTLHGSAGSAKVKVSANESAASLAQAINGLTNQTNISAQASTSVVLKVKGGSGSAFDFTLGNGSAANSTNDVSISATGVSGLIQAVNNDTSTTGITATENASGNVVLTQSQGQNIAITNVANGSFTVGTGASAQTFGGTTNAAGTFTAAAGGSSLVAQGRVSFQSDQSFSVGSANLVGLQSQSTLDSLSSINVTTQSGANNAINVIKFAIQGLNNTDGSLGATQQRLQATLQNLSTTNTNLQNGLGVVQDANIPQVSEQLTEAQIQAQAGVSALRSSTTIQQAFLALLPQ
ncbi:MAG TPA: flagellin [Acetobacteraceae bacterium]|nr:flagellin [Acetobacteraceae bacterium]